MLNKKLNSIVGGILENFNSLTTETFDGGRNDFLDVIIAGHRIVYSILRDMYYLSNYSDTGGSILNLQRNIIEHYAVIEYIVLKGKDKMTKQFNDFIFVQRNQELEYYKERKNLDPYGNETSFDDSEKKMIENIEEGYANINSKTKKNDTPFGCKIESILKKLVDSQVLSNYDYNIFLNNYLLGCWSSHPNPKNFKSHLLNNQEKFSLEKSNQSNLALSCGVILYLKIAKRLVEEFLVVNSKKRNIYEQYLSNLNKFDEDLKNLDKQI